MVCWFGIEVDQGKRSLILDLKTKEGQEVLRRLIERADVLVHNFSRAGAARLGLRKQDLARINPSLLLCRVGAYEGPNSGPWEERKAYDPVIQAASGIMVRYGSREQPEYHGLASCIDYVTGYCAALGAALAIYRHKRDPRGPAAEAVTSLAAGAQLAQVTFAFDLPGRIWDEPSGQHCRGDHALHRLYRAHDGWFFFAAQVDKRDAILTKSELGCPPGLASAGDSELAKFLEACFRQHSIAHWQRVFAPLDVAVFPVRRLREIRRACATPRPAARYLTGGPSVQVVRQRHPAGCLVDTLAPAYARLSRHPLRYLEPAPKPGSDSLTILEELGIADGKQQELIDKGVVALGLSKEYLPP
jgi:crotonobetainyl-CoA:carnitine CoA-transferase CaiB-like acyl-CoA transferase